MNSIRLICNNILNFSSMSSYNLLLICFPRSGKQKNIIFYESNELSYIHFF